LIQIKLAAARLIAAPGIVGTGVHPVRLPFPEACHVRLAEVAASRVLVVGAAGSEVGDPAT
jgi:hypothetical protein